MADHQHRTVERHADVAVIGGSAPGLTAALDLVRHHRSVVVVDPASPPDAGLAPDREEVRRHGGEILPGAVTGVATGPHGGLRVGLAGGHAIVARRILDTTHLSESEASAAASAIADDLDADDRHDPTRTSTHQADWDHRYGGDQLWSGNPNGTLVQEARQLTPGQALDVGAGEGGDAVWLATGGWRVTASDISERALERVAAAARQRGLDVALLRADANEPGAFGSGGYDLVSAQYASIPRTADDRAVHNLLAAVAPGGTLLIVSHDLEPMRHPVDTATQSRPFDPDAYVRVDDVAAVLAGDPAWEVEVHETRPRPPGAASSHHVHDVVLRARRLG